MDATVFYKEVAVKRASGSGSVINPYESGLGRTSCFKLSTCSDCYTLSLATVAPCFFFGLVASMISREERKCCRLGSKGCLEVLKTSFLCLTGWPCPLLLMCYVCNRKENYRIMFDDHLELVNFRFMDCCRHNFFQKGKDVIHTSFLWPYSILQLHDFLVEKEKHGLLRFDWEESHIDALREYKSDVDSLGRLKSPPVTQKVAIIGSSGAGKTELLHKLLCTSSTKDVKFSSEKSHGGVKTIYHSDAMKNDDTGVSFKFLEVWEIAEKELYSDYMLKENIITFDVIIFVYDLSDLSHASLLEMQTMFETCIVNVKDDQNIIVLANRLDLCRSEESKYPGGELLPLDLKSIDKAYFSTYNHVDQWLSKEVIQYHRKNQQIVHSNLDATSVAKLTNTILSMHG